MGAQQIVVQLDCEQIKTECMEKSRRCANALDSVLAFDDIEAKDGAEIYIFKELIKSSFRKHINKIKDAQRALIEQEIPKKLVKRTI